MDPQQGEIYWVEVPSAQTEGSEQHGRRPFIVVSRNGVNNRLKTVIVVPLTTFGAQVTPASISNQPPFRIAIPISAITRDPSYRGPIFLSVAKTDQARVIDKSRLQQKIDRFSQTAIISVGAGLAFVFDIR
jgi:mRNA-degrading endonuclease toxin of MazEF toxin-antitoxin module